jgi:short-subunit dehydrogenase
MRDGEKARAAKASIDSRRFGPWALVTGASSGIGLEFARQIAAAGISVVLVARREPLLKQAGEAFARDFGVSYHAVATDLSEDGSITALAAATAGLDIGLVISNAGTGDPGPFLQKSRDTVTRILRLNTLAHLDIALHFGPRLAARKSGGLLFVGAMGADKGIPMMANDAGAKAYVQSFALSLHDEFKPLGIHVTVLPPGPTETPVLDKFGLAREAMPMKPMPVEQCVSEGLRALSANRAMIIPGRLNRIMNAVIPAPVARAMMAKMFAKGLAARR